MIVRTKGLLDRLKDDYVICAEGYLFELERRGYLQAGSFVPEVVLEHPEVLEGLHREFAHAGSDVVEAFTYYAHRQKLRTIGREGDLELMNRRALEIAKNVAHSTGTLLAGNICNTNIYSADGKNSDEIRSIFNEQIQWAMDADVDFIIGETYTFLGEALLAVEAIKASKKPSVVTINCHSETTRDGYDVVEACKRLQGAGADVVGLNCQRGPATMLPLLVQIRGKLKGPVAALPVPYRTTAKEPAFITLTDTQCNCIPGNRAFPTALEPFQCNRFEVAEFGKAAKALDIRYIGLCCGAAPHHIRALAESLGRRPPASAYSPDMSKHYLFGSTVATTRREDQEYANKKFG